jgi:hypothetical protein
VLEEDVRFVGAGVSGKNRFLVVEEILCDLECGNDWSLINDCLLQAIFSLNGQISLAVYLDRWDGEVIVALALVPCEFVII